MITLLEFILDWYGAVMIGMLACGVLGFLYYVCTRGLPEGIDVLPWPLGLAFYLYLTFCFWYFYNGAFSLGLLTARWLLALYPGYALPPYLALAVYFTYGYFYFLSICRLVTLRPWALVETLVHLFFMPFIWVYSQYYFLRFGALWADLPFSLDDALVLSPFKRPISIDGVGWFIWPFFLFFLLYPGGWRTWRKVHAMAKEEAARLPKQDRFP